MQPDARGRAIGACDSAESAHQHSHEHFGHAHHGHGGHGHAHTHPVLKPSVLGWAMLATLGLVVAEIVGGLLGRSVALLNDAVHNLSDVPALGISWLAMRWAERPADSEKTYGYHRAGTLAAFTNALVLVFLALWLGYEAFERLRAPVPVIASWMIWTSVAALAVTGAIAIRITGAQWLDPILGLAIGLLVLWSSIGILRESSHILLEGRPREMHVEEVARALLTIEGVQEVHDVHIWSLGGGHNALSLHARVPDLNMDECDGILISIQEKAAKHFRIDHTTVQLERAGLPATSGYVMPEPAKK